MPRKRTVITDEMRSEIVRLRGEGMVLCEIAEKLGISKTAVSNALRPVQNGGEKNRSDGISLEEATEKHRKVMHEKHAAETPWMEHIKPLHQHKRELESRVRECEEALAKARQAYRNFCATINQLAEEREDD
jgi:transposase-like protein